MQLPCCLQKHDQNPERPVGDDPDALHHGSAVKLTDVALAPGLPASAAVRKMCNSQSQLLALLSGRRQFPPEENDL